ETKPRVPDGKKPNEVKPTSEGTKAKPAENKKFDYTNSNTTQKTEIRSLSLTNESNGATLDLKEEMKIDATQWDVEGKWDVDVKSTFLAKGNTDLIKAKRETIFKNNKGRLFDQKPRRQPSAPRQPDPKQPDVSQPGAKEKPKGPKTKVVL
ncbi:MAG TPA: hypothetical protein VHM26_18995, partial [Chitinophagaceae bacterium]|nr:hypothetical protein [Chitinophagaceae bacterium]